MGTVVFPEADLKIFLICDAEIRAQRRFHQLELQGNHPDLDDIVRDNFVSLGKLIEERKIWNPVLSDMVRYLSGFEKVVLDIDDEGKIFVKESGNLLSREIFN